MRWVEFYNTPHSLKSFLEELNLHSEFISAVLEDKPSTLLEVGIGRGTYISFFSLMRIRCIGIDKHYEVFKEYLSLTNILKIKNRGCIGDAFNLPFRNKSFDICISQGFFEHFSDQEIKSLLDEQLRVSKKVVFSVPSKFYRHKDFGDERLMHINKWRSILKGYNIVEAKPYCYRKLKRNFMLKLPLMFVFKIRPQ